MLMTEALMMKRTRKLVRFWLFYVVAMAFFARPKQSPHQQVAPLNKNHTLMMRSYRWGATRCFVIALLRIRG
jgi:hypothetical protein